MDPVFILLVVVFLALFFFAFLLFRRTMMGFKEGMRRNDR